MAQYYINRPSAGNIKKSAGNLSASIKPHVLSEFDKHRETLLADDAQEGWASELSRYLSTMERDVTKETDLVEWWQVSNCYSSLSSIDLNSVEPCTVIPNTRANRARCSPRTSIVCSVRTTLLGN